jgi:uncharacterized RDD family membrane protein YckC
MTQEKEDTPPAPNYAGFNMRLMAVAIDMLLIMLLVQPVIDAAATAMFGPLNVGQIAQAQLQGKSQEEAQQVVMDILTQVVSNPTFIGRFLFSNVAQVLVIGGYMVFCWGKWGATLGMWLLRLRVVRAGTLEKIDYRRALYRFLGYLAATIPAGIGLLWMVWDKRRQGWQDKVADTVVIHPKWKGIRRPKAEVS